MDPALEAEFLDDFEDRFADDLDALRDFEEHDEELFSQPSNKTQTQKPQLNSTGNATQDGPTLLSQTKDKEQISSSIPSGRGPETAAKTGPLSGSNGQTDRASRKRDMYEMFGVMSDSESENELVIDAPSPVKDPKPKRPRKTLLDKFIDNASERLGRTPAFMREGEITPPSTPIKDDSAPIPAGFHLPGSPASVRSVESSGIGQSSKVKKSLRVFKRQPEGDSMKVTGHEGCRVYLKIKEEANTSCQINKKFTTTYGSANTRGLLRQPYDTLMRQIDDENRRKVIEESARVSEKLRRELAKEYEDDIDDDDALETKSEDDGKKTKGLWVDKYAPRNYTDLLSDDGVNRNLLFWLKMWDYVVFGKDVKLHEKMKLKHELQQQQQQQNTKFKTKFQQQEDMTLELDEQRRPKLKVALLCGPPGLGKTTLAHIIARHAGYNVVEMNASDDRSQEKFKDRLLSTIQMTSVLAPDQRPNCLVIDEIDGAPQPAINWLLTVIKGGADAPAGEGKKKKKKDSIGPLKRPIICICNDVYVPALKQLRQMAYVTHFPPTMSTRLAQRMYHIARKNQLQTDLTALMALCAKAENDIRSCLNTLQFLQQQGKAVTLGVVHNLSVGQKDQHKSLYTVWQQLFQLPKPKKKTYTNPHDLQQGQRLGSGVNGLDGDATSPTSRFHNMLHVIQACGEHEKLMQGVFENYLDVKFKDPHMDAINMATDWLTFSDVVQSKIARTQNYIFGRFLPFVPLTFHMLFACLAQTKIRYPNTHFEVRTKTELIGNLVTTMMSEVSPGIRQSVNLKLAVTDLLPKLLIILQPVFRPINTQLFSVAEKKQLKELVDTMIGYNLTYRQERNMDGVYNYNLDPNLEVVVRFSDSPPVRPITYAAKQLIAREIELEKMRRSEANIEKRQEKNKRPAVPRGSQGNSSELTKEKTGEADSRVPRHLQKLQPKKVIIEEEDAPLKDFFGRIIQKPVEPEATNGEGKQKKAASMKAKKQLWYSFNTGYSNAVRKNIRIQELL